MNQTVAIVGTHPDTREDAPWNDKSVDIWVFNNQILQGWCPRADACFDMHPPEDIYRRALEHPAFGEWLKQEKGLTYFTPYEMKDIPNNAVFPKDEIVKKYLKNFKRGDKPIEYFTSGPCYAIALAILRGYQKIMLFGIEMESNSEYIYQRDGIALWFGVADALGREIIIPETSTMFYAPLYGYEMDGTKVDFEAFEQRATELAEALESTKATLEASKGRLDAVNRQINKLKAEGAPDTEILKFAQEYTEATNGYEQAIANHGFVNGQYIDCRMWQSRVAKAMEYNGKAQQIAALKDDKWIRFNDRAELSGKVGKTMLPENLT